MLWRAFEMWKNVYEDFSELTKADQMALFHLMKQHLFSDEPDKITKLLNCIREDSGKYIHTLTGKQQSFRK